MTDHVKKAQRKNMQRSKASSCTNYVNPVRQKVQKKTREDNSVGDVSKSPGGL